MSALYQRLLTLAVLFVMYGFAAREWAGSLEALWVVTGAACLFAVCVVLAGSDYSPA